MPLSFERERARGRQTPQRGLQWKRVATALRERIRSQALMPGQQLMTELDLSSHFKVSRATTRRALAELEKEGLIRIEHGRGIFVAEDIVPYVLGERTRWTENMQRFGLSGDRTILGSSIEEADTLTRKHLELPAGAEVLMIDSMASVSGRPLSLGRSFYPAERFRGLDNMLRENPSHTVALRTFGILDYTRRSTRIVSRMPTQREAQLLRIPRARPVLETEKVDVDADGRPIAYGIACYCGDRVQLIVE